jgi:hypothetical protein
MVPRQEDIDYILTVTEQSERGSAIEVPAVVGLGNVAASRRSTPGFDAKRGFAALLLLASLAPATTVAQRTPQAVFTELFAYDPAVAVTGEMADLQSAKQRAAAAPRRRRRGPQR